MDETSVEAVSCRPAGVHAATSARMSRQKRKDTAPEMELRRALYRRGSRYRVNRPLEGMPRRRADVTFVGAKVVVFVDGCFWHRCPVHGTAPVNNGAWWEHKLSGNVARDRETDTRLREAGWAVLRFWEHEDMEAAASEIERVLRERRLARGRVGRGRKPESPVRGPR
ncbi:very short patch repair endonuclease [Nocardiopsis sp. CA-288880]|uniref:very short patch repair endonuclease n=1 Tax=Nocardiopsis sp. CA-288880 TaxID=3239995 RepID=UPI003D962AC4